MKTNTGVWINTEHAFIIRLAGKTPAIEEILSHMETHPRIAGETSSANCSGNATFSFDAHSDGKMEHDMDAYLARVVKELTPAEKIVLFGPAQTKQKLENLIRANKAMAGSWVATIPAQSMNETEMVAWVKITLPATDAGKCAHPRSNRQ